MKDIIKGAFLLAALLFVANVSAACEKGSKTIFSCVATNNKKIEVCDAGKTINYSFGKVGKKPELSLSVPRASATTFQWRGIGRYENYSVDIPNGEYQYNVYSSIDKLAENEASAFEAGVNVLKGDELLASVFCRVETVVDNLLGVDLSASE